MSEDCKGETGKTFSGMMGYIKKRGPPVETRQH